MSTQDASDSLSVVENRPSFVEEIVHTKFYAILYNPAEGPVMVKKDVVD